jgi:hypothetical protein
MDKNEKAKTLLYELNYRNADFLQPSIKSITIRLLNTFSSKLFFYPVIIHITDSFSEGSIPQAFGNINKNYITLNWNIEI